MATTPEGPAERADATPSIRPTCPKCTMFMIAASEPRRGKQTFECLRCGHSKEHRIDP